MKNLGKFFAITALVGFGAACNQAPESDVETREAEKVEASGDSETEMDQAENYAVDTEGDEIHWVGFKTYADRVHNGEIQVKEGEFTVKGGKLTGGSFVIDMTSITNNDLPEEGDFNKARLIGHLKSDDFFHVEQYPTAEFSITKVEEAPAGNEKGATHMISGNLTMRGNTKNITIPAMVDMSGNSISFKTPEFVIDRTKWDVEALSTSIDGLAKDKLVDDSIKLKIDLKANKA